MKYIDMNQYPRRSHFDYFRSLAYPYVGMTANVDVTPLIKTAKKLGVSTFLVCLYAVTRAANRVPQLRQRIVGDQIAEYEVCDSGHTVALADGTFVNCRTDGALPFQAFLKDSANRQEQAKHAHGFLNDKEDETGMFFVSCVPWVAFTQVIQPTPIPADSNPRFVLGKYFSQDGKAMMPLSIQANHALVDGYHIAQFYQAFDDISAGLWEEYCK